MKFKYKFCFKLGLLEYLSYLKMKMSIKCASSISKAAILADSLSFWRKRENHHFWRYFFSLRDIHLDIETMTPIIF